MLSLTRLENCNRNNRQGFSADLVHPLLLASLLNPDPGALPDPTQSVVGVRVSAGGLGTVEIRRGTGKSKTCPAQVYPTPPLYSQ